jgi:hypothetical protein
MPEIQSSPINTGQKHKSLGFQCAEISATSRPGYLQGREGDFCIKEETQFPYSYLSETCMNPHLDEVRQTTMAGGRTLHTGLCGSVTEGWHYGLLWGLTLREKEEMSQFLHISHISIQFFLTIQINFIRSTILKGYRLCKI